MTIQLLNDPGDLYIEAIQKVGEKIIYGTDWTGRLSNLWAAGAQYATNAAIRPKPSTGYQYVATAGGVSGKSPPNWPTSIGQTVQDGSILWTTEAVDGTSLLKTPTGSTWNVDTGLAVSSAGLSGNITQAMVDTTGATEGQNYYARNPVTMSDGTVETAVFYIYVRSGRT